MGWGEYCGMRTCKQVKDERGGAGLDLNMNTDVIPFYWNSLESD